MYLGDIRNHVIAIRGGGGRNEERKEGEERKRSHCNQRGEEDKERTREGRGRMTFL